MQQRTTIAAASLATATLVGMLVIFGGSSNDATVLDIQRATAAQVFSEHDQGEVSSDGPCAPGETCTADATLPAGGEVFGAATLTGDAAGHFDAIAASTTGLRFTLTARNTDTAPHRLTALVSWRIVPASAAP